jgi:RNA polymerase sigma-70 factor, ECF subfamily
VDADPSELMILRQSIHLAFVAALQHLPPKQRAALLLADVLGWSAAEIAESLDTSVASVNSALQRARATLGSRDVANAGEPLSEAQSKLVQRYVDAFLRYDVDELVALLHQDATLSMPPYTLWLRGQDAIRKWLLGPGSGCRGSRLIPAPACASPSFAQYRAGARAVRRPHHGLELIPGYVDAVPDVRLASASSGVAASRTTSADLAMNR